MDVTKRRVELQKRYGWADYRIAKEAGLSPNTVSNIYRRGNMPSMVTLEALCKAFGITMSQFFAEDELVELTPDLRELVARWTALSEEQKAALWQMSNASWDPEKNPYSVSVGRKVQKALKALNGDEE